MTPLPYTLPRSQVHALSVGGQPLSLLVSLPAGPAPVGGYPALFVLDGENKFPAAAMLGPSGDPAAAFAVVGLAYPIGHSRRNHDYTHASVTGAVAGNDLNPAGGGADAFLAALEEQIIPYASGQFGLNPQRLTLFGHSYGGLLALYTVLSRPQLFWGYLASSPSLWYANGWLKAELLKLQADPLPHGWLRHTVGAEEARLFGWEWGLPAAEQASRLEHLQRRNMVGHSQDVAAHLQGLMAHYQFYAYPQFSHGTVPLPALASGVEVLEMALEGELETTFRDTNHH